MANKLFLVTSMKKIKNFSLTCKKVQIPLKEIKIIENALSQRVVKSILWEVQLEI